MSQPAVGFRADEATEREIPREVVEFLVEFAVALHKFTVYPPSHPSIRSAVGDVLDKLQVLLGLQESLSLGVTRDGFIYRDAVSDPRQLKLREFARKLHDEHIGALHLIRGVDAPELQRMLETLARGSSLSGVPLGLGVPDEIVWAHAELLPIAYDNLKLSRGPQQLDNMLEPTGGARAQALWSQLARAAMGGEDKEDPGGEATDTAAGDTGAGAESGGAGALAAPADIAHALNMGVGFGGAGMKALPGVLVRLAEESRGSTDAEAVSIQRYLSELIGTLSEETLRRVMDMDGDATMRRKFVLAASEGLAADAMLALAKAAADASKVTISSPMLRILNKVAARTSDGDPVAEASLRGILQDSVASIIPEGSAPEEYKELLDGLASGTPDVTALRGGHIQPNAASVVATALELDTVTESVIVAVDRMLLDSRLSELMEWLDATAEESEASQAIWRHILRPELLFRLLRSDSVEYSAVERLARRMGVSAADALLDALSTTDDRTLRAKLLQTLSKLGHDVAPLATGRLRGSPWYVQRNLLELLSRLDEHSSDPAIREAFAHPDARVRRAAFKVLLRNPAEHEKTLLAALSDSDDDILRMALGVAIEEGSTAAYPVIERRFHDAQLSPETRAICIRALAPARDPRLLQSLIALTLVPRRFLRRERLRDASPELLAAVMALAVHWGSDPMAQRVLRLAAASPDQEVRNALQAGRKAAQ